MSATRLLVLGVVRTYGRAHGYQVRRELLSWGAEQWANIKPGSIYHALRQLWKNGMLRGAGVEESGEGPERTLFELTEDGETEFGRLLGRALSDAEAKPEFFGAGITFMCSRDRRTVLTLLRHRLAQLQGTQRMLESMVSDEESGSQKPPHVWELFQWWITQGEAAVAFTQGMIDRLASGAYEMADDVDHPFGAYDPTASVD